MSLLVEDGHESFAGMQPWSHKGLSSAFAFSVMIASYKLLEGPTPIALPCAIISSSVRSQLQQQVKCCVTFGTDIFVLPDFE